MQFKFSAMHRALAGAALMALSQASQAAPVAHVTTLQFATPLANAEGITRAVFNWSTNLVSGNVSAANLVNFSMTLYAGATAIYTDNVLVNGVAQAFGGTVRAASEPYFNFDLGTNTLNEVRNIFGSESGSTGTQYAIFDSLTIPLDGQLNIVKYTSGNMVYGVTEHVSNQATVPEPGTLALIALAGTCLALSRKRAA